MLDFEKRRCNDCGEAWIDRGDNGCLFCGSADTEPIEDVPCPMGCGRTTDDPLDGPCSKCWDEAPMSP